MLGFNYFKFKDDLMRLFQQLLISGLLLAIITPAFATNGYLSHGYGIKSRGLAGAGVALPQESLIIATNPAGISFLGNRVDVSAALFSPKRNYEVTGEPSGLLGEFPLMPGKVESDRNYFVIPEAGATWQLDEHKSFGIAMFGNGGMNTDYSASDTNNPSYGPAGTFHAGTTGVDLMQLLITPTFSYRFDNDAAIGISAVLAFQRFEGRGFSNFGDLSNTPNKMTDKGHDNSFGGGINLGFILPITEQLTFGGGYRSKVYMSEFDDYKGFFAEKGNMDIPASATIGLAWQTTEKLTVLLDVQKTWYSHVNSTGNGMMPAMGVCMTRTTPTSPSCLGGNDGIGFGWDDMTVVKLGLQYDAGNNWTWRAGYSHGNQPVDSTEVFLNIVSLGVIEEHFTAGFTKAFDGGRQEINFAAMYAPSEQSSGPISSTQSVELEMKQYQAELGWSLLF